MPRVPLKLSRSMPWVLFAGADYYARGGAHDYIASFATHETAMLRLRSLRIDNCGTWAQLVDIRDGSIEHWRSEVPRTINPLTALPCPSGQPEWTRHEIGDEETSGVSDGRPFGE